MYPSVQFLLEEAGDRGLEKNPTEVKSTFEPTYSLIFI
jgi:hypothetical protein